MSSIVSDTTQTLADGSTVETIVYSDGSRSVQYTPGAGTPDANQLTLQQQARTAMVNNRTYTALASPTNAQQTAQVKALTQQMNGVIRLLLGQLDATN